jgi:hypothetical protein
MRHAIADLEGQLQNLLDSFCKAAERGDVVAAAYSSAMADDYATALSVQKKAAYPEEGAVDPVRTFA